MKRRGGVRIPPIKLRWYLLLLTLVTLLPMVVLALVAAGALVRREREAFERGATERTRALVAAVDEKLRGSITTLSALASLRALDRDDLRAFHADAARILASQPDWLTLTLVLPSGREVLDVRDPDRSSPAPVIDRASFDLVVRTQAPAVGSVVSRAPSARYYVPVRVPVRREDAIRYVLSAEVAAESIGDLLVEQRLPPDWVGVVVDGSGRVVSRTAAADRTVGQPASDSLRAALAQGREGWFHGSTLEGTVVYTPFTRSAFSGWTVALGIPSPAVDSDSRRTLWRLAMGFALASVAAAGLALLLGRVMAQPIASLAAMAKGLGQGPPTLRPAASSVTEVDHLRRVLDDAFAALRARDEARERLAAIVEASSDAIIGVNLDGTIDTWNPAAHALFGYSAQEAGGRPLSFLSPPARADEPGTLMAALERGEAVTGVETVWGRKDGTPVDVSVSLSAIRDADGRLARLAAAVRDVGARQRGEEALRAADERVRQQLAEIEAVYRTASVGLCVIDTELRYRRVNDRLAEMHGVPATAHLGRTIREVVPGLAEQVEPLLRCTIETGEPLVETALSGTTPARPGMLRHWVLQGLPLQDAAGAVIGINVAVEEVTERHRAEEERARLLASEQHARREAELASRAKDEFLAMLGHELRNPLGAITSAVHLLDRIGAPDGQAVQARQVIGRQAEHLARLVDDLLDVGRVATGKIALQHDAVDLGELARRVVESFRGAGRTGSHTVSVDARPAWIMGDGLRLEQVVGNLLTNALKYTPAGGAIRVRVEPAAGEAVLSVEDSGIGIARELRPRIFDLFVQGNRSLDRAQGGLGIGLTLVQRLVRLHGGRVEVSSPGPGRGSVFTVRLPLAGRPLVGMPAMSTTRAVSAPRRILLVEDNDDARETLRHLLELEGHVVHEAEDGTGAVEVALREQPDVAIIDIGLPGLDGYEVARRIRWRPEGQRIVLVALTGYGTADDHARSQAAGFDAHLVKPVDPGTLTRTIARVPSRADGV